MVGSGFPMFTGLVLPTCKSNDVATLEYNGCQKAKSGVRDSINLLAKDVAM